jgi:glutamyl-tRNA reductase
VNLHVVGCSHHQSSTEIRERLSFPESKVPDFLKSFYKQFPGAEAVLLSTCNRTEFYAAAKSEQALPTSDQMIQLLATESGTDKTEIKEQLFSHQNREAVRHLFAVTSSLDSMVIGETQILSQVKRAYQLASEADDSVSVIHQLFQNAIRVARRISNETDLQANRVSVPSVAICDLAKQIFETLKDKQILIIGAGEMAEETLNYIRDEGGRDIVIVNRTQASATQLAEKFSGSIGKWESLQEELAKADLVVSTTGAQEPIVTLEMFQEIEKLRRRASLFVLDLAVPRDFDSRIADRENVYLYTLDDLQLECERNQQSRESHYPKAKKIIEQETGLFFDDVRRRSGGSTIAQLKQQADNVKEAELKRLKNRLDGIAPEHFEQIEISFHRLVNKILHPPLKSLQKDATEEEKPEGLLDALKKLFQLGD